MIEKLDTSPQREFQFGPDWFDVREVAPGITAVREPYHSEDVVSYLIEGKKGYPSILIDTGMGLSDLRTIVKNSPLRVLLTHTHWDHMGSAADFSENVYVYNNEFEIARLARGWQGSEIIGYDKSEFHQDHQPRMTYDPAKFVIPGSNSFYTLDENTQFDTGDDILQVIHTPGHTPGSVCYFLRKSGLLFTGDTLYPGPEYLHLQESSPIAYANSLKYLQSHLGTSLKAICPGHNEITADPKLLFDHVRAMYGEVQPISAILGKDEFGQYQQFMYHGFSLLMPYKEHRKWR